MTSFGHLTRIPYPGKISLFNEKGNKDILYKYGEGNGNPLQYSPGKSHGQKSLGAQPTGVAKSQTQLSD